MENEKLLNIKPQLNMVALLGRPLSGFQLLLAFPVVVLFFALHLPVSSAADQPSFLKGKWYLEPRLSDEFKGASLNKKKWLVGGLDGVCANNWRNKVCSASSAPWEGRAPSLFVESNIVVKRGKLKLKSRIDPRNSHFPVYEHGSNPPKLLIDPDCNCKYRKYTTAAVVSKASFRYGYFETRAKIADVKLSSAFWAIGECFEIDVFESVGDKRVISSSTHHDYGKDGYTKSSTLSFDPTTAFHTYGARWSRSRVDVYVDGDRVHSLTKKQAQKKKQWPKKDCSMHVWLDNEVFSWYGYPKKNGSFEIDYVRVWSPCKKRGGACKSKRRCQIECCSGRYRKKKKTLLCR